MLDDVYPSDLLALTDTEGSPKPQRVRSWFDHKGFGESNAAADGGHVRDDRQEDHVGGRRDGRPAPSGSEEVHDADSKCAKRTNGNRAATAHERRRASGSDQSDKWLRTECAPRHSDSYGCVSLRGMAIGGWLGP